jgi:hypothetical protein
MFQDISFDYNFFTGIEGIKNQKEFSESDYVQQSNFLFQEYAKIILTIKKQLCELRKQKNLIVNTLKEYISKIEETFQRVSNLNREKFKLLEHLMANLESPNIINLVNFVNVLKTFGHPKLSFTFNKELFTSTEIDNFLEYLQLYEPKSTVSNASSTYQVFFGQAVLLFPLSFTSPLDFQYYIDLTKTDFYLNDLID